MQCRYIDFRQMVYDHMMGYSEEPTPLPIKNEFDRNTRCREMLEELYQTASSLNTILNTEESPEVNSLINTFYAMQEHLCKKMFDYGVYFQKTNALPPEINPEEVAECLCRK